MQNCWKVKKEQRPTFTQLKMQLKAKYIALSRKQTSGMEEEEYCDMT